MPSMTAAFDIAFRPTDQPDLLAGLFTQILPHVDGCLEMARCGGEFSGHLVSEGYCGICHQDAPCEHTDALAELLARLESEKMADYADAQIDERPW